MLRVGIIGSHFGAIGLLPAFDSLKECRVVAICGKRTWIRDRRINKNLHIYEDWQDMLRKETLDAVAIATPPRAQFEIAKTAIRKGLHVFAEKPLARNLKEAQELVALAKKKKVVHGIDFIFPEIAAWIQVKKLLDQKTFGTVRQVSVDWDWLSGDLKFGRDTWKTKVSEGGGVLSFYFSHGLYYLEHFAGKITTAQSVFTYSPKSLNGGEVGIDMLLRFKSGATGNVHVSCNSPGRIQHRLMFICELGIITLENKNAVVDNFIVTTYGKTGEKIVKVRKDKGRSGEDERVKIVKKLTQRFVDACTCRKQMTPSFANGLRVQELIEKIRKKATSSR